MTVGGGPICVVLVPMFRRSHRVGPLLESLSAATGTAARPLFICSPDDRPVLDEVERVGADVCVTWWPGGARGDYARKINYGFSHSSEPWIFTGADDLDFRVGWLDEALLLHPADVIGTNDLGNERVMRGDHATHSLVRRQYVKSLGTIDEPGKVLHEGYIHNFCDDELVGTAISRGMWAFAADSHVEHLHPHWGKASTDDVYDHGQAGFEYDRRTFQKRRRLWT